MDIFVERGVNMATTGGAAAWCFELAHWGVCGQGATEADAVADLLTTCAAISVGRAGRLNPVRGDVVERVDGDEQAFTPDYDAHTPEQVDATLRALADARERTIALVATATAGDLDQVDPDRTLPDWASWHSARDLAWHIADTESRYYLPALGLPSRPRAADLVTELVASAEHLRTVLAGLPAEPLVLNEGGEVWTTVKVLRRLAWHERSELRVLERLLSASAAPTARGGRSVR